MTALYGTARSRASRSLIALEEVGLRYQHVPLFAGDHAQAREVLRTLNPNGHVPVLEDDGLIVWESMAINLYLAENCGGALWPDGVRERAGVYQWSFWAQTEMDRRDWQLARRSGDEARIARARAENLESLAVLNGALRDRPFLLGDAFSFADLNVAATISQPNEDGRIDWDRLDPHSLGLTELASWLERCTSRPSWRRVRELP